MWLNTNPQILPLLALVFAVGLMSSNAQRLVGTIYGVNNAALLNVFEHSNGGAQTKYVNCTVFTKANSLFLKIRQRPIVCSKV